MARAVILGSAHALPDERHENSHLALVGGSSTVVVDCAGQPLLRWRRAGLNPDRVGDLVLTHFHPDHVYGVPMLLMALWLRGRRQPLRVHGLEHCVARMAQVMALFEWEAWPGMFPVSFEPVEAREAAPLLESDDFCITASPMQHFLPTIGLRVEDRRSGRVLVYSCDTEPCPAVVRLACGADLLIHEATGAAPGHSSAAQAARAAHEAGVGQLVLIHYTVDGRDPLALVREAQAVFDGPVRLAADFMHLTW